MRNTVSVFPKEAFGQATALFGREKNITLSGGGNASSKAMVLCDIFRSHSGDIGNVLWVVSEPGSVGVAEKALAAWGDRPVYTYRKRLNEEVLSFPTASSFERTCGLELVEFVSRTMVNKKAVFVIDLISLLKEFPRPAEIAEEAVNLKIRQKISVVEFIESIVSIGYELSEERQLKKGQYLKSGDSLMIFPVNCEEAVRVEFGFDEIEKISGVNELKELAVFPVNYEGTTVGLLDVFGDKTLIIDDEVDVTDEYYDPWNEIMEAAADKFSTIAFMSFNEDVSNHAHLHLLSVLKYRTAYDFANDLRDKISAHWKVIFFTKHPGDMRGLFADQAVPFKLGMDGDDGVFLVGVEEEDVFPQSFQAPAQKICVLNDVDLAFLREKKRSVSKNIFDDFLTSLKEGDYVVHADHGVACFMGLDKKTVDGITKEYLKLGYAENDKLFVPIDQADKVSKYIGSDELMPKLTRLGSAEWNTITSKVRKETQKIAKELLKLYAERKAARGHRFALDNDLQEKFEKTFQYEETPGQIKAINDVKADMESDGSMDRLVCGDVGFGKTEVAMRAAFKAVQGGKQVAVISPITILADQHYRSFKKRMDDFHVRVEMLSRFRTAKEQEEIVKRLAKGEVDIIIGTHRLIQPDVKFKDLGLVVVDEEQRFGVKQKEKLKEIRKNVDVLTLTATPIPRTLNICLNKLRDITTITTPPFGRLPIITEVRKYSPSLVREAILREIQRGGQIYFLHNRVQTIDGFAERLSQLVPEARIVVAHGKLGSGDLEERILSFKDHKFDVLVSSTIIENGIDLANANTLIVNNAEKFGLAQLYQLRGRVGRGKKQAYAYFLYHGQRLKLDAKKRLRAIVEASDLGSGFQIAMKDLEIRGAGDILGANQHGVINVVGVAHFIRMLNRAVADLKDGRIMEGEDEITDVSIELPVPAYIPDGYIAEANDKIAAYQRLSSADSAAYLDEVHKDLLEDYGKMPLEVENLFSVIELKIFAKKAGLVNVKAESVPMSKDKEIVLHMSKRVKPANIINLLEYNSSWRIVGSRLRINVNDLGSGWFAALQKCVEKLGVAAKHRGENK